MDYNQDNQINYTEFLAATVDPERLKDENTIHGLFNQFDLDNDG
jgi:Ca2+-binding EF-hand superfamily protein